MKKTISLLLLVLLAAGFYALITALAQGAAEETPNPLPSPIITQSQPACAVWTGIEGGTVNLRACPGAACGAVLHILTEGETLTVIQRGAYLNVETEGGVRGWLNSKYCKGP